MPETVAATPPTRTRTPLERVTVYQPLLTEHGWTITYTESQYRARLDAVHPSGATVMVTAGCAGRNDGSGRARRYVLNAPGLGRQCWFAVNDPQFAQFAAAPAIRYGRKVPSKCRCRTHAGRSKLRWLTEARAKDALLEARIGRTLHHDQRRAEQRAYPCPDDDRVWHLSSIPSWKPAAGESPLWDAS